MDIDQTAGDPRTFAIIGAAMEVQRILRPGYLESIYASALAVEFGIRGIPFVAEVPCGVEYKGHRLTGMHRLDFVCYREVIVEVKARSATVPADHAQVLNYLAVSGHRYALLLNFGAPRLTFKRFVL